MRDHEIHTFQNGIRLVYKQVLNTKIAHCGYILDIGSRDENNNQLGLAHFWEHMVFKGTKKRKAFHILNRLDSVGGELNAYTTKEKICFYASVLDRHLNKAIDLLSDITFDSIFPENQIEREKNVILEEMSMYLDNPEDAIQDDFEDLVFSDHPLGKNILGTKESIAGFTKMDFLRFLKQNLNTQKIVFSVVTSLPFKKVISLCEKYMKDVPTFTAQNKRKSFSEYIAKTRISKRRILQAHCGIGRVAYPLNHDKKLPFILLSNIIGGPGMNSRLNLSIREKYGFVYSIDANYSAYMDTGLFSIFFATDTRYLFRCVDLVLRELKKMRNKELTTLQLHRAKEQFIGQIAISEENNTSLMLAMGKSLLDMQKIDTFDEIIEKVRKLSSEELLDTANEMFSDSELSFIYYKPENE